MHWATHTDTHTHTHFELYTRTTNQIKACARAHTHTHTHILAHMNIANTTHTHTHTHTHIGARSRTRTRTRKQVHTLTHTHTHTHTHRLIIEVRPSLHNIYNQRLIKKPSFCATHLNASRDQNFRSIKKYSTRQNKGKQKNWNWSYAVCSALFEPFVALNIQLTVHTIEEFDKFYFRNSRSLIKAGSAF